MGFQAFHNFELDSKTSILACSMKTCLQVCDFFQQDHRSMCIFESARIKLPSLREEGFHALHTPNNRNGQRQTARPAPGA